MPEGQDAVERPRKVRSQLATPASDILVRANTTTLPPLSRDGTSFAISMGGKARRESVGGRWRFR